MLHKFNMAIDRPYAASNPPNLKVNNLSAVVVPIQQSSSPRDRVDTVLHMIGIRAISGGTRLLR